jgi:hypothetical protein
MLRNSSTYIYLTLFVGLLCYLTFIDKKIPGTKEREDSETQLYKFDQEDVNGLEITNVHGNFIFKKNNNHWEIKSPVNTLADGAAIDEVLNQIASAQPQRIIPADKFDEATLKEWGLSPAAERVIIHTRDKDKMYELLVGRKMAINDSVYARCSGRKSEPVRIIPSSVKEILQKGLSEFRSRNVFDFDLDKATRISSQVPNTGTTPAQDCEVERKDGKWTLQKPLEARASDPDVQALLNKILAERAIDFVTDDASNLSAYGLTSPTATFSVTIQPDEELVLQIGNPVPDKPDQVYAQRLKSNSVFTLSKANVDELLRGIPNVRDRHVLPFNPDKATGLTLAFANKKFQIKRENNLWSTVGEAEGRADLTKANDLLTKLAQLETTPVLTDSATDLKPFGLDKPQGKITIQSSEFKPDGLITLLIGKAQNKLLYVRNSTEPFIYTVPDSAFDFLPANNLPLRDARVNNLPLKQVKGMTITIAAVPPIILTRSPGGTWTPTNLKDRMVDSIKAETQASLLCSLQAKAWLGPALPAYGLSKPLLTISLTTDQPAPTILHIGAALPDGGHAAQIEGSPIAFELSEGDYDYLSASSVTLIPVLIPATNAPAATPPTTNAPPTKPK